MSDDHKASTLCEYRDPTTYGTIRVELWPQGLVLWVGGEIAWTEWEAAKLQRERNQAVAIIADAAHRFACAAWDLGAKRGGKP